MKSDLPKVLVPVCGRPMIDYVLDVLLDAGVERVLVVVGYRQDLVREALAGRPRVAFVEQTRTTGHRPCRDDVPAATGGARRGRAGRDRRLAADSARIGRAAAGGVRPRSSRPACWARPIRRTRPGWGRIVRDAAGEFQAIVEEKDATRGAAADHRSQHEHVRLQLPRLAGCAGAGAGRQSPAGVLPHRLPRHPQADRPQGAGLGRAASRSRP